MFNLIKEAQLQLNKYIINNTKITQNNHKLFNINNADV